MNTSHMIFCFGSNLGGIHDAGAARFAYQQRGALPGIGVGHFGQSYAIPTKGIKRARGKRHNYQIGDTLSLNVIRQYVDEFLEYADHHQELEFQVTCIGCGLAGLKHEDVAPMFENAPMNCFFDEAWRPYLVKASHRFWGSF